MKTTLLLLAVLSSFIFLNQSLNTPCKTNNSLTGCETCNVNSTKALDVQNSTFICTDITNCASVSNQLCQTCESGYFLQSTILCSNITISNCLLFNSSDTTCLQCEPNYIISNNTCQLDNVPYCTSYNDTTGACINCVEAYLDPVKNCSINLAYCTFFDFSFWKCLTCPDAMVLHSSGQFCITEKANCIEYIYQGCNRCGEQYLLTTDCIFNSAIYYQISSTVAICLDNTLEFNSGTGTCAAKVSQLDYCSTDDGAGNCTLCLNSYFLVSSSGSCSSCETSISNCLICTDALTCSTCSPSYFLNTETINGIIQTSCRDCSVYGCKLCQVVAISSSDVQCLSCERGYSLFNNSCFKCDFGFYFDVLTKTCLSCSAFTNCQHCDSEECLWCDDTYALVDSAGTCQLISGITAPNLISVKEILIKYFPSQEDLIFRDTTKLMESCQQSGANEYSCKCASISLSTNLCYTFNTSINELDLGQVFGASILGQEFLQNYETIRLMAQIGSFDALHLSFDSSLLMSQRKIATLLEVYSQILRRNSVTVAAVGSEYNGQRQTKTNEGSNRLLYGRKRLLATDNQILSQLFSQFKDSFSKSFSKTETTVIYGNGYYLKYYPNATATDNHQELVTVTSGLVDKTMIFVWFENLKSTFNVAGNIYGCSPTASSLTLSIQQLVYPSQSYSYLVYLNEAIQAATISASTLGSNFLSFGLVTSSTSPFNRYTIKYELVEGGIDGLYSSKRIELIFYQSAFIYILIFLIMYLFFIPFCSIVDLCKKSGHRRKKVRTEEDITVTDQNIISSEKKKESGESESKEIISVNYKDFFPLYNIPNTPRPRRLLKLCLFILNLQHGITFLTLIYFNLDPGHPVLAIVLGLPAYLCTIIMGYISGIMSLELPGAFKYFINVITLGYWILWVILMPRFLSAQYNPYIYVLAITFMFLDLLFDLLETFMVYFLIKQSEKQAKMFSYLAAWLSKRGYYEYDKLAKQLNDT